MSTWKIEARTPKGKPLVRCPQAFATRELAEAAAEDEGRACITHFARCPTIAIDDDGNADDLYDMLRQNGVQFVPVDIEKKP
jgi:hypothetical protein